MRTIRVRAIIGHEGKFLFVKHAPSSDYWALPGGGLEEGEVLVEGLEREIIEELGIQPQIGRLLYVQQYFKSGFESLELFFEVTNGADFQSIDLSRTTHGYLELSEIAFIHPSSEVVQPAFLSRLVDDLSEGSLPKVLVSE